MPAKAAGWRIEPPVSVPVAPGAMSRRDRRRRSARRSARRQADIAALAPPWADHRTVSAGLVRRAHRELVHVELAEHPRARLAQVGGDGALVGRLETLEDAAAGGRIDALRREQVLDAERDAGERREVAAATRLVRSIGSGKRVFGSLDRIGVERPRSRDRSVEALGDLARA